MYPLDRGVWGPIARISHLRDELARDEVIRDALGDHVFERFVEAKTEEWDEYRKQVSSWEVERYLEAF